MNLLPERQWSLNTLIGGLGLLMILLTSCQAQVTPEYQNITTVFTKSINLNYLLYVPDNYRPNEAWPLIMFLTGLEGAGDIDQIRNLGFPALLESGLESNCFVVAPQLPGDVHWDPDALKALLEEIQATYHIDVSQQFITGIGDRGGWGVYEFGVSYPGVFQRFAPIGAPACTEICRLGEVSTWIFHGALDSLVPVEDAENMFFEMQTYCGTDDQITVYEDLGHEIWDQVFSDNNFLQWFTGTAPTYITPTVVVSYEELSTTVTKEFDDNYLLYLPEEYDSNDDDYPLVLFLHGSGSAIQNIDDIRHGGPPLLYEQGVLSDFILLCPQLYANVHWDVDRLHVLTQHILDTYRVDIDRIYITGLSRGGFGTWEYAVSYPELFAAVAPIAARDVPGVERLANSNVAIFHGALDNGVPWQGSQVMYNRLAAVGANVTLTLFEGVGHNAWDPAYNSEGFWTWLLSQHHQTTSVSEDSRPVMNKPFLTGNFPNPFNPSTTITYYLPEKSSMSLKIFDILGHEIYDLPEVAQMPGFSSIQWPGKNDSGTPVKAGVYFCQLRTRNNSQTIKMVYLR